jgi:DNA-directed RNA polymerase subunit M/transcription elongation factor TFIIS
MLVVEETVTKAPGYSLPNGALCGSARARARAALYQSIPSFMKDAERDTYTAHLEACAAAYSTNDYATYMSIMSRVIFNIKSNGEYIIRTYPVSRVCKLSHKRLHAKTAHAERDAEMEARLQALLSRVETEAENATKTASSIQTDTKLRCPKCKTSEDITRVLAQLRRGDEGMTTRCMCKCGHTWNMSS